MRSFLAPQNTVELEELDGKVTIEMGVISNAIVRRH